MGRLRTVLFFASFVSLASLARAGGTSRVEGTEFGPSVESVTAVLEAGGGKLWIGTQGGLARFDPADGWFERFPAGPDGPGSDYIVALKLDPDGTLWVCTANGGSSRRDPVSGRFRTFTHDPSDASSIAGDGVYGIAEDRTGRLWLGTDAGVNAFDRAAQTFRYVPLAQGAGRQAPTVTSVVVDQGGTVWACTLDSGLWRLDADGRAFHAHPFRTSASRRWRPTARS